MTTIINSIGSAARDYADPIAWIAGLGATASGNVYRGQCYPDSEFQIPVDTRIVFNTPLNTGSTYVLEAAPGFAFSSSNPARYNASISVPAIRFLGPGSLNLSAILSGAGLVVTLSGLQIKSDAVNTVSGVIDTIQIGGSNVIIQSCLIETATQVQLLRLSSGCVVKQCVLIQNAVDGYAVLESPGPNFYYGNTIVAANDVGSTASYALYISTASNGTTFEDCAIFGFINLDAAQTPAFSGCMTDLTGTTGLIGGKTYGNQFTNTSLASGDWRVKNSSADIYGAGVQDLTNNATDIFGATRKNPPDIGAAEFAVPPTGGIPVWLLRA